LDKYKCVGAQIRLNLLAITSFLKIYFDPLTTDQNGWKYQFNNS